MANTKSTQHEIDLTSSLNLNKFKADIKPYEGFNERNSPYYGGCLSPLYIKDLGEVNPYVKYQGGYKWETKEGKLYKDGVEIMSFSPYQFIKTYAKDNPELKDKNILDYYDNLRYVEQVGSDVVIHFVEKEVIVLDEPYLDPVTGIMSGSKTIIHPKTYIIKTAFSSQTTVTPITSKYSREGEVIVSSPFLSRSYFTKNGTIIELKIADAIYVGINNDKVQVGDAIYHIESQSFRPIHVTIDNTGYTYGYTGPADSPRLINTNNSWALKCFIGGSFISDTRDGRPICVLRSSPMTFRTFRLIDDEIGTYEGVTCYVGNSSRESMFVGTNPIEGAAGRPLFYYSNRDTLYFGSASNANGTTKVAMQQVVPGANSTTNGCMHPAAFTHFTGTGVEQWWTGNYTADFVGPEGDTYLIVGNWCAIIDEKGNYLGISYKNSSDISTDYGYSSACGTLIVPWGSVGDIVNFRSDGISYYDKDKNDWAEIKVNWSSHNNSFEIIEDYVVINTPSYLNCINLKNYKTYHWGYDFFHNVGMNVNYIWPYYYIGRMVLNFTSFPTALAGGTWNPSGAEYHAKKVGSGINLTWKEPSVPSIKGTESILYVYNTSSESPRPISLPSQNDPNALDLYIDSIYRLSCKASTHTGNSSGLIIYVDRDLENTKFPGGEVRYNLPLLTNVIEGPLDATIVNFGSDVSFFTIYYDNKNRYQYYSASITEFEHFFIIQGQAYGIARNKIYSVVYSGGAIQSSQPVVSIEGLEFVGNTIYNAYFYSPTARAIYSFGADNDLRILTQADTITGVTGSDYTISTSSIILGTPEATYVLNEKLGIYRLNSITDVIYADQNKNSVTVVTKDHAYEVSYEEQDTEDGWVKQDIVLDTSYYGAGSNVVSVNDCWYVRVTDPEHGTGEIKLAVSTLTDVGRQTETKTVKVKKTDWDELTDTVYIRFQPKLQRAVGVSLHIESPFKVGYIGVGATPETLQLNKVNI